MQLLSDALTLDVGLDWTGLGAATPVVCLVYTVAVRSQSTHHICSNTAISELMMGSNTSPTDSTSLWVTMQHKSGMTILIDKVFSCPPRMLFCFGTSKPKLLSMTACSEDVFNFFPETNL